MERTLEALIGELFSGSISSKKFIAKYYKEYLKDAKISSDRIFYLLEKGIEAKDHELIDEGMTLLSTKYFAIAPFSTVLCNLLLMEWHRKHEDIVILLTETLSPDSVDYLFAAAKKMYSYLDYDDSFQLARKCIKCLSSIGSLDAIEKLKELSNIHNKVIAGYAKKELLNKKW